MALNAMLALTPGQLQRGVVAGSSGNHGHAVARCARMLGTTAVVVLPRDVPAVKRDAVLRHSAQVVAYDPSAEDRDAVVAGIAAAQDRAVISSYDDPAVIAGAATVAVELLQDAGPLDLLLVPVGGGGLAAPDVRSRHRRSARVPGSSAWSRSARTTPGGHWPPAGACVSRRPPRLPTACGTARRGGSRSP